MTAASYDVDKIGEGERILPAAVVQKFMLGKGGALVPWVEGKPVASTVTHAGIAKVERYGFAFADRAD